MQMHNLLQLKICYWAAPHTDKNLPYTSRAAPIAKWNTYTTAAVAAKVDKSAMCSLTFTYSIVHTGPRWQNWIQLPQKPVSSPLLQLAPAAVAHVQGLHIISQN